MKTDKTNFNTPVVCSLAERFGLSEYYVRECVKGRNHSPTADTIRKEYKRLDKEIQKVLAS